MTQHFSSKISVSFSDVNASRRENTDKLRIQKSIADKKEAVKKLEDKIRAYKNEVETEIENEKKEKRGIQRKIKQLKMSEGHNFDEDEDDYYEDNYEVRGLFQSSHR